jgi:hypothetical protein
MLCGEGLHNQRFIQRPKESYVNPKKKQKKKHPSYPHVTDRPLETHPPPYDSVSFQLMVHHRWLAGAGSRKTRARNFLNICERHRIKWHPAAPRASPPTLLHLVGPLPLVVDLKPCFGARQCTFWSYSVAVVPQNTIVLPWRKPNCFWKMKPGLVIFKNLGCCGVPKILPYTNSDYLSPE